MNDLKRGGYHAVTRLRCPRAEEPGPGFEEDAALLFLERLAEQGRVAIISADGRTNPGEARWEFHLLPGMGAPEESRERIRTAGASAGQCLCLAVPRLCAGGLPVSEEEFPVEGTGTLVLDWLVEHGMTVFLKADGDRPALGWTLLVQGGPLTELLRNGGRTAAACLHSLLPKLHERGLVVPV
ncbi:hypothetical protein AB0K09_03090 [Streptomyces sp. NPDC049577]|uniref:hypothetical protein n=1 Tax=Streptomyces sp. NPDC049577 TaxID=3155153 RepID=UPI00344448A9